MNEVACSGLVSTALNKLGVHELLGGNNRGPLIDQWEIAAGVPLGSAWCAVFVMECLREVFRSTGVMPQVVVSPQVVPMWNKNPQLRAQFPEPGFIVCWKKPGTILGHCGIVAEVDPKGQYFKSVEGNTSSSDPAERDGQGVYLKIHELHNPPESTLQLLGFLRPY